MPETARKLQPLDGPTPAPDRDREGWYIQRQQNRWYSLEETRTHPFPGTYPSVISDGAEWGGWRVSAAEYNRAPWTIEYQARLIADAPELLDICRRLADRTGGNSSNRAALTPAELGKLREILDRIGDEPVAPDETKRPQPIE